MKIDIEKLTNGYVVSIDGKRTFCDVPEAICGLTSEAVIAECARLDKAPQVDTAYAKQSLAAALAQLQADGQIKVGSVGSSFEEEFRKLEAEMKASSYAAQAPQRAKLIDRIPFMKRDPNDT